MSAEISPGACRRYGLQRVCEVLGVTRSSLYAARGRGRSSVVALHPGRRGPKPRLTDTELLAAIQADLAASPFIGEGHITTAAPDLMWGTDGIRIETAGDGWVWLFSVVDHCHAECVGWHAVKIGDRFAALEPIAQGLTEHFGGVGGQAARGSALRFDRCTHYSCP